MNTKLENMKGIANTAWQVGKAVLLLGAGFATISACSTKERKPRLPRTHIGKTIDGIDVYANMLKKGEQKTLVSYIGLIKNNKTTLIQFGTKFPIIEFPRLSFYDSTFNNVDFYIRELNYLNNKGKKLIPTQKGLQANEPEYIKLARKGLRAIDSLETAKYKAQKQKVLQFK